MIGQREVISSLKKALAAKRLHHAYLFTGPGGTGKTSIARIVAVVIGVAKTNVIEIDAATHSGVEEMRRVTDLIQYKPLRGNDAPLRFVIVDEAHMLSKATWNSLLKSIEEPPPHVFWAFCTTEPDKVPDTIRQRCLAYALAKVDVDNIQDLLERVARKEGMVVPKETLGIIARHALGSPRRALNYLMQTAGVTDAKEMLRLFESGIAEEEEAFKLARLLCSGKANWKSVMEICAKLQKESPEGVRLVVLDYVSKAVSDGDRKDPTPLLHIIDCFRGPYLTSEKFAPLYLSLGKVLFS